MKPFSVSDTLLFWIGSVGGFYLLLFICFKHFWLDGWIPVGDGMEWIKLLGTERFMFMPDVIIY